MHQTWTGNSFHTFRSAYATPVRSLVLSGTWVACTFGDCDAAVGAGV